jgi:hypothetical protein
LVRKKPHPDLFAIFGFIFVGVLIAEIAVLIPHLLAHASVEESFLLLTIVTVVAAVIFLVQALPIQEKNKALSHPQL